jgi:hypothetical protein
MWRIGIGLVAGSIILANGYLHGLCTNRWHRSAELEAAIGKVERVSMTIGDWQARSDKLEDSAITGAGIEGYFLRHYENPRTGKTITVLLMCGLPGPLSVHTPEVCYGAMGFNLEGSIAKVSNKYHHGSAAAEFLRGKFSKAGVTGRESLRIEWSWGAGGKWLAPSNTRLTFAQYPALYKLYVIQRVTRLHEQEDEEVYREFLEQLLPALDKSLFAAK